MSGATERRWFPESTDAWVIDCNVVPDCIGQIIEAAKDCDAEPEEIETISRICNLASLAVTPWVIINPDGTGGAFVDIIVSPGDDQALAVYKKYWEEPNGD